MSLYGLGRHGDCYWIGIAAFLTMFLPSLQARDSAYLKDRAVDPEGLVTFEELAPSQVFLESAAPGVLGRVCAPARGALQNYFQNEQIGFDEDLVYRDGDRYCHIFYRPTLAGFRAEPKNSPVRALLFDFDSTRFVVRGDEVVGDSLDVVRSILQNLHRPIPISIGLGRGLSPTLYEEARLRHFGDLASPVMFRDNGSFGFNPWVQDFIKSGRVGATLRVLVPRRLFEAIPANGPAFLPHLDELCRLDSQFVRSHLSWEGGDLLFMRDPRDRDRLLLFYGEAARPYWGRSLTPAEYAYVLKAEFGAEEAIDLSGLAAHVDYEVAFLPDAGIAVLGTHLTGNVSLAREALASLIARMPSPAPTELVELRKVLVRAEDDSGLRDDVLRAVRRAAKARDRWRLADAEGSCPEGDCPAEEPLSFQELETLLALDPERTRARVRADYSSRFDRQTIGAYLAIVESQFLEVPEDVLEVSRRSSEKLAALGFEVIPVPRLGGHPDSSIPWAGLSHVNLLLVDHKLFVPRFGFGSEEDRLLEELSERIPGAYQVIPIFAQHLIVHNGGLHCISGILR
jgi:hypothetical protein